jgi:hypothetical protein
MRDDNGSWFDDPEWERLRHEINGRSLLNSGKFRLFGSRKQQSQPQPVKQPPLPTMKPAQQPPAASIAQPTQPQMRRSLDIGPTRPQQYVRSQIPPQSYAQPAEGSKKVNVSLNLTIPDIKLDRVKEHKVFVGVKRVITLVQGLTRKQLIIGGTACLVLISSFGVLRAITGNDKDVSSGVLGDVAKEPEFDTVLPKGSKEEITSPQIAYDGQRKVASFADILNGINITVSQQPLPESFKDDPDKEVRKIAESFNADMQIKAGGITAYKGTNANGPQTIIFHRGELLIFMFSEREIPDDVWGTYILSLD